MPDAAGVGKNKILWPFLGALLYFGVLWCLGFPQPGYDDLFYTGAALHLADGGDFSNPLLDRQMFPSHYFYVYPPLHSFVLAQWLKIFGIHAASQTGFFMVNALVICAATLSIMRRRQAPAWAQWTVPLAVSFAFFPCGLRPETLAVALTLAGFDVSERAKSIGWLKCIGFLLMFLGASCAPRVMFFSLALASCAGFESWRENGHNGSRQKLIVFWLGALAASGLVFLTLIQFRLHEFLQTFHFHATRVEGKPLAILIDYAKHILGILQWPLILLPLAMLAISLRKPWNRFNNAGIFILVAFVPLIATGGIGHGFIWWSMILIFIFAGSFAAGNSRSVVRIMGVMVVLALLMANRKLFANTYGIITAKINTKPSAQNAVISAMRPGPEHPLLLDSAVARYVFDYRIPTGCFDVEFGSPFPGGLPGDLNSSELRPGDVYLVGPDTVTLLKNRTSLQRDVPIWNAFGLQQFKFVKDPRAVYVVSAEDCKESRARTGEKPVYLPKEAK